MPSPIDAKFPAEAALQQRLDSSIADLKVAPGVCVGLSSSEKRMSIAAGDDMAGVRKMGRSARFPLACLMKPQIALLCLEMHVRGALDIYAPITEYLPELGRTGTEPHPITLAHLLSHTSGYQEPRSAQARWKLTWDEFAAYFPRRKQLFRPGTVWSYTQTGHAILGRILERITGRDPIDLLKEELLSPLGINVSPADGVTPHIYSTKRLRYEPIRVPAETGFFRHSISPIALTIDELTILARALCDGSLPAYFSARSRELLITPVISIPEAASGPTGEAVPSHYAMGLGLYGRALGHNGSFLGTTCGLRMDTETGLTVAIAANTWAPVFRDTAAAQLLAEITGDESFVQRRRCIYSNPLSELEGHYESLMLGLGEITIERDPDQDNALRLSISFLPDIKTTLTQIDGELRLASSAPGLTCGLCFDEETGKPAVLLNMSLYARA